MTFDSNGLFTNEFSSKRIYAIDKFCKKNQVNSQLNNCIYVIQTRMISDVNASIIIETCKSC